jgi:hypothetical protein
LISHTPQTFEEMKARFHLAVDEPVDTGKVAQNLIPAPSKDPKHIFDYSDGMRLIISTDRVIDTNFLHISASGNDKYVTSIKGEGLAGLVEDVMLRISALMGKSPEGTMRAFFSENGTMHVMFFKD